MRLERVIFGRDDGVPEDAPRPIDGVQVLLVLELQPVADIQAGPFGHLCHDPILQGIIQPFHRGWRGPEGSVGLLTDSVTNAQQRKY